MTTQHEEKWAEGIRPFEHMLQAGQVKLRPIAVGSICLKGCT